MMEGEVEIQGLVGAPRTLPEFAAAFPSEEACIAYLFQCRFPHGWACPVCHDTQAPYRHSSRRHIYRCRANHRHEVSLTANTIMHRTKLPIRTWFWGAFLVTHGPPGMSALQLQKQLGIGRYETAFHVLHKMRAAMVRPARALIGSPYPVEVDETWIGGATQGEGKGVHHKTLVVGAVEVRPESAIPFGGENPNLIGGRVPGKEAKGAARKGIRRKEGPRSRKGGHGRSLLAGRLRLQVVPNRTADVLSGFVGQAVLAGSLVRTDGWVGYEPLASRGFQHDPVPVRGDPERIEAHLPMIHIVFGNLEAWLLGTHHGVSPKHLQAYLNEFAFRFNRRFWPRAAFDAVLGIGAQVARPTYAALYDGIWTHPGGYVA
jgi:transposase-like protein